MARPHSLLVAALVALVAGGAAGCSRGAKTPDEAYRRLVQAVTQRDGAQLFDALDLETRWSWMSIQRANRESYDIILSNFPPGTDRDRQLRRCEEGATSENPRQLFAKMVDAQTWADLSAQIAAAGTAPKLAGDGASVQVAGSNGRVLLFRHDPRGKWGWGYAGMAEAAEQLKRRALADLELIRTSAADYERAATRRNP